MANFARLDENNIVIDVLAVHNDYEHRGEDFLANELGLGGRWIQTSFSGAFRGRFAGIGYKYDEVNDVFISPQPFPSWKLDSDWNWQPPVERPQSDKVTFWDEESGSWKEMD